MGRANTNSVLLDNTKHIYRNKYYNLFRSNYKWHGLTYRQEEYLMRKLWSNGTIAAFKVNKNIDMIAFANWAQVTYDMYGLPESVQLINEYGSPLVPKKTQVVDKEVVIGYLQSNHKPLKGIVEYYIDRIAQVDVVINTNLNLQKMPFVVALDDEKESKKLENIINGVMNNEEVIRVFGSSANAIQCLNTNAPYVIDKLVNFKRSLESELKTILGINNKGDEKIQQLQLSEVNANNSEINAHDTDYKSNLDRFCEHVKEVLGIDISVEVVQEPVKQDGIIHNINPNNPTGPKQGEYKDDNN